MSTATHIISLFIPVLAFLFEAYPRILNRKFGVDVWTHLLYLKEFHKQGGIPKKIKNGFLVPGIYDYPPAFIYILSKFPYKIVVKYEFLFSPFFDAVHLLIIYFIVYQISGNIWMALTTQLIYSLTPIIIIENSSATPRSLGYTLFTLVFMLIFSYLRLGSFTYILAAVIFGAFIFLSHRFTTQGFLFYAIFFSLFDRNFTYLTVFIASFILALIISRGFYIQVLQGHLGNLIFWKDNIRFRFYHQVRGVSKEYKNKDFVFTVYSQFLKLPPFVLSITNPWTISVFYYAIFYFPDDYLYQNLLWWVLFAYLLSLLMIWIPRLRFLGEGQRYLELAAFPASFLSANLIFRVQSTELRWYFNLFYIAVGLASVLTIVVIQRKAIINEKLRTLTPELQAMFSYLKKLKKKPKLLCIPHQITTSTIYHTGCKVFVNADYKDISKISMVYPFLRKPAAEIIKKYNLDMILLNEDYASLKELKLIKFTIVHKVKNYTLIDLR